jgi:sugar lactone lactonase YvrE
MGDQPVAHDHGPRTLLSRAIGVAVVAALAALTYGCASSSRSTAGAHIDEYAFWPPPPNPPRIQFLRSLRFSSDVEPTRSAFDKIVFGAEVEVLPIAKPYGVEMWRGRLYVCDITNPNVVILDLVKRETRLMTTRGVERMTQPTDIAIADDGMKYVIDRRLGRIFVFNADDKHVTTFGDEELVPSGVAVHGDELFVPDFETQSVLVMDRFRGDTLRSIGGPGGAEGQFIRPLGIDVDGDVYVGDVIRGRLQKFDASGNLTQAVGQLGDAPGNFVRPKHVAVDAEGVVYVVDAAFQNVQMFNREGELLMYFGGPGEFPGAMSLPAGVAVHDSDIEHFEEWIHPAFEATRLVVVTNQFGVNKVSVYALGQLREGYTIDDIAPELAELRPPTRTIEEPGTDIEIPEGGGASSG